MVASTETVTESLKATSIWDNIIKIDGGWRIKENTAGTHYVDLLQMIVNHRVVLTPKDDESCYVRHWCFSGNTTQDLLRAFTAAIAWDGALDSEPVGWNKNGQTGERRPVA